MSRSALPLAGTSQNTLSLVGVGGGKEGRLEGLVILALLGVVVELACRLVVQRTSLLMVLVFGQVRVVLLSIEEFRD